MGAMVLVNNVKQSLVKVLNEASEEYLDGGRDANVEVILTTGGSKYSMLNEYGTSYMFVAFHPSYVELCWKGARECGLGQKICTFITDECTVDTIAEVSATLIEQHYKYR